MSARTDVSRRLIHDGPLILVNDPLPPPPPPPPPVETATKPTHKLVMTEAPSSTDPKPVLTVPNTSNGPKVSMGPSVGPIDLAGEGTLVIPEIPKQPISPVREGPHLLTSGSDLKPPYPANKLLNEEEGAVTVKLTIDAEGRVIAVDPVGRADPEFLDAARRHLLAHWRFRPATEDGRAVLATTVVTLHFELNS